jgi:hypothetical protein
MEASVDASSKKRKSGKKVSFGDLAGGDINSNDLANKTKNKFSKEGGNAGRKGEGRDVL